MTPASRLRGSSSTLALAAVLLSSTVVRALLWLRYDGFTRGDDVEILESAFRYGVDLDYSPWEIRNLTLPILVAAPLRLLAGLGVTSTDTLITAAVVPFILSGTLNVLLVHQLARRWSIDERVPLLASALYGLHWLSLVYGSAPFPRVVSTTAVLLAALLVSSEPQDPAFRDAPRTRGLLAGGLMGLAFAIRYSEVLFLAPLLAFPFLGLDRRRATWQAGMILTGFGVTLCLLVGVVDWLTWGSPFASLVEFFRYTLLERQSSSVQAVQPTAWYLTRALHWLPVTALPLFWLARRERVAAYGWLFVLPALVGLSLIHHKELRYLQGIWPFVAIMVAAGTARLVRNGRDVAAWILLLATILIGGSRTTIVQKRSMAAVDAARYLAVAGTGPVGLSQAWAYGGRLYLASRDIVHLPRHPATSDLEALPRTVRTLALYEESLSRDAELLATVERLGFSRATEFRRSRSESVLVFVRVGGRRE